MIDSDDGVDSSDGSVRMSSSNSDGAMRDELIETDDTVEIVDGVRDRVTAGMGNSTRTGVGDGALGRSEIVDCVGVSSDDGGDGSVAGEEGLTSVTGVASEREDSPEDARVSLGRNWVVS